ncbi:MAG: glutamate racemase [Spirochaetales bacterium]|nr:glutamate racemase [Spirochaetales bacterium]
MNRAPIVFIDSGIGGLPYLEWIKKRLPEESFVYVADNENFPYGMKTKDTLKKIMYSLIKRITDKYNPKAVVIACNTASVISLSFLRENFSMPIIGVVPAVKPAAIISEKKRIGLMASNSTIEDSYTEKLIEDHASDCIVCRYAGSEIIDFIENNLYGSKRDDISNVIQPAVDFFIENDVDNVVLGCTHFLFLEDYLKEKLGKIKLVDSRDGVGNQIIRILRKHSLLSDRKNNDFFIITGEPDNLSNKENYNWISEKYGLCRV